MTFLSNIASYKIEATRIMQASYISRKLLIVRHHITHSHYRALPVGTLQRAIRQHYSLIEAIANEFMNIALNESYPDFLFFSDIVTPIFPVSKHPSVSCFSSAMVA